MTATNNLSYKWCIFDLDGTLIDSSVAIGAGVRHALEEMGINGIADEDIKRWIGRPLYEIWEGYAREHDIDMEFDDPTLDRLAALYLEGHNRLFPSGIRTYNGAVSTLDALRAMGVGVAVATTKWESSANTVINGLQLDSHLDSVCGTDPGKPVKPDPYVVNLAVERLNANPSKTLMIGDTVADLKAANAAGCPAVAVTFGFGKREDLLAENPEYVIDSLGDLMRIVVKV